MPHEVTKKCPFCGQDNVAVVTASLELEGGGIDEASAIFLDDPALLAGTYSIKGLETMYLVTTKTGWFCKMPEMPLSPPAVDPECPKPKGCGAYYSVKTFQDTHDPKLRLAEQMCK